MRQAEKYPRPRSTTVAYPFVSLPVAKLARSAISRAFPSPIPFLTSLVNPAVESEAGPAIKTRNPVLFHFCFSALGFVDASRWIRRKIHWLLIKRKKKEIIFHPRYFLTLFL